MRMAVPVGKSAGVGFAEVLAVADGAACLSSS
jgi:hypothetical protein